MMILNVCPLLLLLHFFYAEFRRALLADEAYISLDNKQMKASLIMLGPVIVLLKWMRR